MRRPFLDLLLVASASFLATWILSLGGLHRFTLGGFGQWPQVLDVYQSAFPFILAGSLLVIRRVGWSQASLAFWLTVGCTAGCLAGFIALCLAQSTMPHASERWGASLRLAGLFSVLFSQLVLSFFFGLSWLHGALAGLLVFLGLRAQRRPQEKPRGNADGAVSLPG